MRKSWKLISSATLLTALLAGMSGQAQAGGFTSFSIGTSFGDGGHHNRHHARDYGRRHHDHGSRSRVTFGVSTVFTGYPYNSGYYAAPYSNYSPYRSYAVPQVYAPPPVYAAPQPAYYNNQPGYNGGYQQSAYAPQADSNCLQEREYQTHINIGGNLMPAYGTACLQPDGSWKQGPAQLAQ